MSRLFIKPSKKAKQILASRFVLVIALIFLAIMSVAQPPPPVSCQISGTTPVSSGSTQTYTLSPCSATSWSVTCGSIQSWTSTSVTVYFNSCGCTSSTITANGSTAQPKVVTITYPTLTGGTISNPTQN